MYQHLQIICLYLCVTVPVYAELAVPSLKAPVMDLAGMISDPVERQLNEALQDLWSRDGSQVAVLTVPNLEGESIEGYSIRVVDAWKLGHRDKDNGVLLIFARDDRKMRIEVGQGLEGVLTDAYSSRIIRNSISPLFQKGDFDGGVILGVQSVLAYIDPEFSLGQPLESKERELKRKKRRDHPIILLFILIFVVFVVATGRNRRYRSFSHKSGYWGGGFGGGGGFSGGGGGFSGGGGGFSGGGASGGW